LAGLFSVLSAMRYYYRPFDRYYDVGFRLSRSVAIGPSALGPLAIACLRKRNEGSEYLPKRQPAAYERTEWS